MIYYIPFISLKLMIQHLGLDRKLEWANGKNSTCYVKYLNGATDVLFQCGVSFGGLTWGAVATTARIRHIIYIVLVGNAMCST